MLTMKVIAKNLRLGLGPVTPAGEFTPVFTVHLILMETTDLRSNSLQNICLIYQAKKS